MQIETNNTLNNSLVNNTQSNDKNVDLNLKKATDDFESFFMRQFMDISLKSTNLAGKGPGSDIIKSMYVESIASNSNGSVGISDMLYRYLTENKK